VQSTVEISVAAYKSDKN